MYEKIEKLLEQPWFAPTVAGVVGFCGGLGLGVVLERRREKNSFHEMVVNDEEADSQMEFDYDVYEKVDVASLPTIEQNRRPPRVVIPAEVLETHAVSKTVKDLSDLRPSMITDEEVSSEEPESEKVEEPLITVSEFPDDDWDYEAEIESRTSNAPYVIHKDEFYADEMNYTQLMLTYYMEDDIMADEDDSPVYNYNTVVGELKFGHGSDDPDVFYVRNDRRRAEYEITRLPELYSRAVLGLEIEDNQRVAKLKHSHSGPLKFRME